MSLVATYVRAIDGRFYKEPTLYGPNWSICFDDDDPPEIIILADGRSKNLTESAAKMRAKNMLKKLKIKHGELQMGTTGSRLYPPKYKVFRKSYSFFFQMKSRIPVPRLHEGAFDDMGSISGVIYNPD